MAFSQEQQEIVDQITSLLQQLEASTVEPEPEPFEVTDQDFNDLEDRVDDLEREFSEHQDEYDALLLRVTTLETTVAAIQPQIDEITEKQGYEEDRLDKVITEQDVAIPAILKHFQPQP